MYNIVKKYNLSLMSIFHFMILMILLERIPIGDLKITFYKIIVGSTIIITLIDFLRSKKLVVPIELFIFSILLIGSSMIGLVSRNHTVFIQYILIITLAIISYNILKNSNLTKESYDKICFTLSILAGIGSLTLLTDYYGLTRFSLMFGEEIYLATRDLGRGSGILGGETNATAARLVALLPFCIHLVINKSKNFYMSSINIIFIFLIVTAIVLTGSRMGMLALSQIIIFVAISEFQTNSIKQKFKLIASLVLMIALIYSAGAFIKNKELTGSRFESLGAIEELDSQAINNDVFDSSMIERIMLIGISLDIIRKHPLFGVGLGNAKYEVPKYIPVIDDMKYLHNTYLEFGADHGIPMLLLLITFLVILLKPPKGRNIRFSGYYYKYYYLGLYTLLFCWFFLSDFSNKLLWSYFIPFGLILKTKS